MMFLSPKIDELRHVLHNLNVDLHASVSLGFELILITILLLYLVIISSDMIEKTPNMVEFECIFASQSVLLC